MIPPAQSVFLQAPPLLRNLLEFYAVTGCEATMKSLRGWIVKSGKVKLGKGKIDENWPSLFFLAGIPMIMKSKAIQRKLKLLEK